MGTSPNYKPSRQEVPHGSALALLSRDLMNIPTSNWLTATEAAGYLKVEPRTLLMWARQGKVRGHVLSGTRRVTWRFRAEDLDAMLTAPSVALSKRRIH